MHGRLHRHLAVNSPRPHGASEGIPVGPPVPGHAHDVLLVGVPVTPVGRPHTLQLRVQIGGPLPPLSNLVVRHLGLALFQYEQPVLLSDPVQPRDIGGPPEAVHDHDSRGTRGHDRLHGGRVQAVRHRIYVGEHRKRPRQDHGLGDLGVPEGRYDDLVADADAGGSEHCSSTHASDIGSAT